MNFNKFFYDFTENRVFLREKKRVNHLLKHPFPPLVPLKFYNQLPGRLPVKNYFPKNRSAGRHK